MYALFNKRDVHALAELMTQDIEWDWSRSLGPDAGTRVGRPAVLRFFADQWDHWDSIEMRPGEIVEVENEFVVDVTVCLRGRDGLEVQARGGHVQRWEDGLLARYSLFQGFEEALAATRPA